MINFTGTWILNLNKSNLQSPAPDSSTFIITHEDACFRLNRTHIIGGNSDNMTMEHQTDGSISSKILNGIEITAKMYWKDSSLVYDAIFRQSGVEATNIVAYSLTDDAQVLVAEEDFNGVGHRHHNKWVFDRQV